MTESSAPLYIVHTESSLGWGGQEIRVLTEAEAFLKRGHRVEIWAAPGSNILEDAIRRGVPSRALPIARRGVRALRAVRRALAQTRPDVVNTHSSTDTWLVAAARLLLHRPPPMVRTRHISAPVSQDFATRWLYAHATCHVVTTGERLREQLVRDLRLRPGRVTSVPTGVDSMRFQPGGKADARRVLGLNVDDRLVGIVATLRSWKGHRFLVEAFARLAAEMSDLRLLIVGDGPMHASIVEQIMRLRL
ncbi:MAG: glycosyltransferase family 4 protein, partial [Gammaproteobacteria bacterium]